MRTRYFIVQAEPHELERSCDLDELFDDVAREYFDYTGIPVGSALDTLTETPARIWVMSGEDIEDYAQISGTTTGFAHACRAGAGFFRPSTIMVCRLDYRVALAHEMVHVLQWLTERQMNHREAAAIADAVTT